MLRFSALVFFSYTSWCYISSLYLCFFFFFQAEDGIRDKLVTGVQTCALPIYPTLGSKKLGEELAVLDAEFALNKVGSGRSEERRVGKECRSRWSPYH